MLQGVRDDVRHIADPRSTRGGSKEGCGDPLLAIGAAVTHDVRGPSASFAKVYKGRFDQFPVPRLAQAQTNDFNVLQRSRFPLAYGGSGDPKDAERLLAANLYRTIGDAHPRGIEGMLGLLYTMSADTQGPRNTRREVRHPGDQANSKQRQCTEHAARRAERQVTVQHKRERKIAQKKWVWSMAWG